MSGKLLEFVPYSSVVHPSFWSKVAQIKLEVDKLQEQPRSIYGFCTNVKSTSYHSPLLEIDSTSFNQKCPEISGLLHFRGKFLNKNTIEEFKRVDKVDILFKEGLNIWENIISEEALKNPSLLNTFFVLIFSELKKYHFYYWCAYPCLLKLKLYKTAITKVTEHALLKDVDLQKKIYDQYIALGNYQKQFFLIRLSDLKVKPLGSIIVHGDKENNLKNHDDYFFCFSDSCMSDNYSGWPLRNYILFLLYYCPHLGGKSVNFLSIRFQQNELQTLCDNSLVFTVNVPNLNQPLESLVNEKDSWTGWERNDRGNFGPKMSNMRNYLDPKGLAQASAELNLKLMKWNLVPNLDLEKIHSAKCLLIGAGTLGCAVARTLMAWGVQSITFIDGGNVSFSNPVRQYLYTYEDSLKGISKCEAAVKNLKNIYPMMKAEGHQLSVPMPGHPVGEGLLKETEEIVEEVEKLIKENDIIFLLTDSRESRWLPTVLGSYFEKIVINAALGFDSYLVMRHGIRRLGDSIESREEDNYGENTKKILGPDLGCYFCNDVTAPGDSMYNRTLDQQCTVTRPGVSLIAGSLAVELAISILQHEDGGRAAAYYKTNNVEVFSSETPDESILGILPHSIRGFLSSFTQVIPATKRYRQCIACSENILNEYKTRRMQFILEVFNNSKVLEELTGIDEIYKNIPDYQSADSEEEFTD